MKHLHLRNRPHPLTRRALRKARTSGAFLLSFCLISYGFLPLLVAGQVTVSGSIHPSSIEIDNSANVRPGDMNVKNAGATVDWVKDFSPNTDTPSLTDGIAIGVKTTPPDQTGAAAIGHWNGVRIVDGFAGADQDIFLKGGKVNDTSSWNIGPGSVGSSKYDATQMYMANNQSSIFFGMERNGNNGTTAFDFEFTQQPPVSLYVPDRTDGDILISFELQGSGGSSGSVQTYIFEFDGTTDQYEPLCDDDPGTTGSGQGACPAGLFTSINGVNPTPAEPWGYVDGSSWVLEPGFALRMFAEAQVPLSLLPNVNTCGGSGFVQIRTRASSTLGSDAKDTTKIFEYSFGGPAAVGTLTSGCGLNIGYDAAGSTTAAGGTAGLTYEWFFQKLDGSTWVDIGGPGADSTSASGTFVAPGAGTYRAILRVTEATACFDDVTTNSVTVYPDVGGTASLLGDCDDTFAFSAQGTGGSGSYAYEWTFYKENGATDIPVGTSNLQSGTIDIDAVAAPAGDGEYYAVVRIRDANSPSCFFDVTPGSIAVRHPLTVSIAKSLASTNVNMFDGNFSVQVLATLGNHGSDTITKQWQQLTGNPQEWANVGTNDLTLTRTMSEIITFGTTGSEESATILGDLYMLRRSSLQLKVTVSRSLNGQNCPVTSDPLTVKALKGIDP